MNGKLTENELGNLYEYKVSASGRINLIGEHVDYCGGKVFPAAISLKNDVYVRANGTDKINISFSSLPDEVTLDINKLDAYKHLKYGNYQAGSAYMWQQAGHKVVGADMYYDCNVPFGSGLSSSAAIEVSTIAALATIAGEKFDKVEVALLSQKAEREYCGVNCGIMDQYASACGKDEMAMLLDCKTLDCKYVPARFGNYSIVIINCNRPHSLVESKYNERRAETEYALDYFRKFGNYACLADLTTEEFGNLSDGLAEPYRTRAKHVVYECDRVNRSVVALEKGDMAEFGKLLNASHASLRDLYLVSCTEMDTLVDLCTAQKSCLGARMIGAGFGGCAIALVKSDSVDAFKETVGKAYKEKIGYAASFYPCTITDGITSVKL
ncbi:MAG: galactokinase [Clostridia bacterium]|nr:galactokinase [Clostridia bacterium]